MLSARLVRRVAAAAKDLERGGYQSTLPTTRALIRDMALAGCTGVFVGFESLTDENLADAHKKTPKTGDYARPRAHAARVRHPGEWLVRAGLSITIEKTFSRAPPRGWREPALECSTFHILTAYPATPLFRQMEAQGRLLHRDWSLYDTAHAVFQPKHMSPEEIGARAKRMDVSAAVSAHRSIWRRRPERLAGCGSLPGDVIPLQAIQPFLASADQARPGAYGMAAAGGTDTNQAFTVPASGSRSVAN